MEGQDSFITRELNDAEVGLGEDCDDAVADVEKNADLYTNLYAANQECTVYSTDLINEAKAHMEDVPYGSSRTLFSAA